MGLYDSIGVTVYLTDTQGAEPGDFLEECRHFIVMEEYSPPCYIQGENVVYKLVKAGISTYKAFENIYNKQLEITGYLGLKDESSISIQYITVKKKEGLKHKYCIKKGFLEKVCETPLALKPGLQDHNTFVITLPLEEEIMHTLRKLRKVRYYPNYYGHQRFGYQEPLNHKKAISMILGDRIPSPPKRPSRTGFFSPNFFKTQFLLQSFQSYVFNTCLDNVIKKGIETYKLIMHSGVLPGGDFYQVKPPLWVNMDHHQCATKVLSDLGIDPKVLARTSPYIRTSYRPLYFKIIQFRYVLNTRMKKTYVILKLPPSSYASLFLREVFKENKCWVNRRCVGKIYCKEKNGVSMRG